MPAESLGYPRKKLHGRYQGDLKGHGDRPTFPGSNDSGALYV